MKTILSDTKSAAASDGVEVVPYHGFVRGKRGMVDIGTLGGTFSTVTTIAENGLAVGWSFLTDGSLRAISSLRQAPESRDAWRQ